MDESAKNSPCKECNEEEGLHAEVEHLRQHLAERDTHIVALEGEFIKCGARASELEEELNTWREKYERLYDSHKRVQKLNQVLEDKLLQMVDKMKGEKSQLTKDIATLSVRLAESKHNYSMLQKENERYKNDMNLAIQLLQCKPDNFVAQKLDNLPIDTQTRVSQYVMSKTSKPSSSIQSKNGNSITEIDTFDASEYEFNISASLMSKILEDSIQDTVTKHCDTCTCNKTQNKPFCYNETFYSVSTQTHVSGEINDSHCLSCKSEVKSAHSNISITSISPHTIKLINEKSVMHAPLYLVPQPSVEPTDAGPHVINTMSSCDVNQTVLDEKITLEADVQIESVPKIPEDLKQLRMNSAVSMEPSVHHKLCDRTKTSMSSKKSSIHSVGNEDLLISKDIPDSKEIKPKSEKLVDNINLRKSSQSSMGAVSRASSVAKSTVSTHKSNTQVGPGPRFCHLRMQAGSKNILLDNAEPDVPPVLYRRLSKCNDNSLFKDLNDDLDTFIHVDRDKVDDEIKEDVINDNVVVESTLIDVHVDNNIKEPSTASKNGSINPVLLNVSSSPLQPLKTHNFSNSSEHNNNNSQSIGSQQNTSEIDNLLNDFTQDVNNTVQNNNDQPNDAAKKPDILTPTDNNDVKIFNFDRYEQNMLGNQYSKPLRKIDMAQLHSLENTRISKDLPPKGDLPKIEKKPDIAKPSLPPIVNVYPNLTQTHLKVNENDKVFTNEHSTSSLSSDDSAAMLQKQQLLRVAEWVEKNLEQQNNFNDPLEDDVNFSNKATRRNINLTRLTETLNELALNMPHPVSKYSNFSRDPTAWSHNAPQSARPSHDKGKLNSTRMPGNIMKETIFPVECGDATITEVSSDNPRGIGSLGFDVGKELREAIKSKGHKDISPEDLARMEYNVKKFLLSGPHWASQGPSNRSRCTSSKTETDV